MSAVLPLLVAVHERRGWKLWAARAGALRAALLSRKSRQDVERERCRWLEKMQPERLKGSSFLKHGFAGGRPAGEP